MWRAPVSLLSIIALYLPLVSPAAKPNDITRFAASEHKSPDDLSQDDLLFDRADRMVARASSPDNNDPQVVLKSEQTDTWRDKDNIVTAPPSGASKVDLSNWLSNTPRSHVTVSPFDTTMPSQHNCTVTDNVANCSNCNLLGIPGNLPANITQLILSHNRLNNQAVNNSVLGLYRYLQVLKLDHNSITCLQEDAFHDLEQLQTLDLSKNHITYDQTLNMSQVFRPLNNSLEFLALHGNTLPGSKSLLYPDGALSLLTKLRHLFLDGLMHAKFGCGFQKLVNLISLSLSGHDGAYCDMVTLNNETFQYLGSLVYLNVSNCSLSQIESGTFEPLQELQILDVSDNVDLGLEAVGNFMYGLRDSPNLRHLRLQNVVQRFSPCIIVYSHTLQYFKKTNIQLIEAMNNEIEMIEHGALQMLPPTLTQLNLTNNRIMFGAYWQNMASLGNLTHLYLDGLLQPQTFPNFFPNGNISCPSGQAAFQPSQDQVCACSRQCSSDFQLPLPPHLQVFNMHSNSLAYVVKSLNFCSENNLTHVDLSANVFKSLIGPVTGLQNLSYLNLSSCFIETIGDKFLDNFPNLIYLNLFQNLLGECLDADVQGRVFDHLNHLTYLNLSFNNIYRLNKLAFKNLNSLQNLDLSINRIGHVNFSITAMKQLRHLDLHKNDITTLPQIMMEHIDQLLQQNISLTIDMRQNPIHCDCENLDFLEWVVQRKVFGTNYSTYFCKYPVENQPAVETPEGYHMVVNRLRRECAANIGLFLGVVAGTVAMIGAIMALVLYRFRWTLRYWYHAAKLKMYGNPQEMNGPFEYDVFVSYAHEDTEFVTQTLKPELEKRGLKLLIHGEEFKVGRHITDNILMAVRDCRKTLVLITRLMLSSHWCTYELQMARMESISTGRDVLIFVFQEEEDVPDSAMSPEVLAYIKTSTYISYPKEPGYRQRFWDKLAHDVRS